MSKEKDFKSHRDSGLVQYDIFLHSFRCHKSCVASLAPLFPLKRKKEGASKTVGTSDKVQIQTGRENEHYSAKYSKYQLYPSYT